jgi:fibronectin-binding autotransporter adhesin
MQRSSLITTAFFAALCLAAPLPSARAVVTCIGEVDPSDPTAWDGSTLAYVGHTLDGSVTVDTTGGITVVTSSTAYIGNDSTINGTVTMDGAGTTWNNSSELRIGEYGNGTLNVTNGGVVNSYHSYLGVQSGSTGTATVDGTNSTWSNNQHLYVGVSGNGILNITNGGAVGCTWAHIGQDSGSTGTVTVDGTDPISAAASTWSVGADLYVGPAGSGTLHITNGGVVNSGYYGYHSYVDGIVTVNGLGSTWNNSYELYVGNSGNGALNITGKGVVSNRTGIIGNASGSTGIVTVDGGASTWINNSDLLVGGSGTGTLNVTNGGRVSNNRGHIGVSSGSTGTVTVDGHSAMWTNGEHLYVGYDDGSNGTLNITNGGAVSNNNGYIGHNAGSTGQVTVDGTDSISAAASTWSIGGTLLVGESGNGTLHITNGGAVTVAGETAVANNSGSTGTIDFGTAGGTLTTKSLWASPSQLTGTGTIVARGLVSDVALEFDASHGLNQTRTFAPAPNVTLQLDMGIDPATNGSLGAGYRGTGSLSIRDGLTVNSASGCIGYHAGSTGTVTVAGDDVISSTWANSGHLYVGEYGTGTLNITHKGAVSNNYGYIGYNPGSKGTVNVDGIGSTWTNNHYSELSVGHSGVGTLNITGGGAVSNTRGYIGNASGSTGTVTVAGTGSTWTNYWEFYVGVSGDGTLNITNKGAVSNSHGFIGNNGSSTGTVTVNGSGSTWTNNGNLHVGYLGIGALNITGGGTVTDYRGHIGVYSGSTGTVTVSGPGSTWTNSENLYVGTDGTGSGILNINGGAVSNVNGYVGYEAPSTGTVTVAGAGSTWTNSGDLVVGYSGAGTLNITGGASVASANAWISFNRSVSSGSKGTVNVDGIGSTWTNYGEFHVGPSNGTLNITGGGAVIDAVADGATYIGTSGDSTGVATVSGAGSKWTNKAALYVGNGGTGTLVIASGGTVSDTVGYIANISGSKGTATVAGTGVKWTNSGNLYVGKNGAAEMDVIRGAAVSDKAGYIGYNNSASGVATVSGAGSKWTNSAALYVGYNGKAALNISNGGLVTAKSVTINTLSLLSIDVANNAKLKINNGAGTIANNGKVRIMAGAAPKAGAVFAPIAAKTWNGNLDYQALGGVWNADNHKFTVSPVQHAVSGKATTIYLYSTQRILTHAAAQDWTVGTSFLASKSYKPLTFKSTAIANNDVDALEALAGADSVLGGWAFAATKGYTAGSPVYLSFDVGADTSFEDLQVWRYSGTKWSQYAAGDLNYGGTYANFTVTGLGRYAVTDRTPGSSMMAALGSNLGCSLDVQSVPEPSGIALLLTAGIALLGWVRWKRVRDY